MEGICNNILTGKDLRKKDLLQPCPFCGGRARLEKSFRTFIGGEPGRVAFVFCDNCGARSGRVPLSKYGCTSNSIDAVNEVIAMWNNRTGIVSNDTKEENALKEYIKDQLDYIQCIETGYKPDPDDRLSDIDYRTIAKEILNGLLQAC